MKILFASSECAPYSKSGGLADVAFSLPPALKKSGDEIAVITPLYQCVEKRFINDLTFVKSRFIKLGYRDIYCGLYRGERAGVTIWFVDNKEFFDRPKLYGYGDDPMRFAFFSKAVIELLPDLDFMPQIIHCNDWETALVVIYLKDSQVLNPGLRSIKTVYSIHNIAYQGQYGANQLTETFALDQGWYAGGLGYEYEGRHDINLMKGAMLMANAVSTVSPNYARELHSPKYGCGLNGVVDMVDGKLYGILNGIDVDHYNPTKDPLIPANFSKEDMTGKRECKRWIQEEFGLMQEDAFPLLGFVARLNEQKGIELIKQILPGMMDLGIQLIVFGQGDQAYVDYFNWAKEKWPGQLGFSNNYTEEMASKIFAGADMYLMPSRFEPCGLSQMMAMRYGTVPIVHETGGLRDSVRPFSTFDGLGDGFSFTEYTAKYLYLTILQAVKLYFADHDKFMKLQERCMRKDLSWDKSAEEYNRMYSDISDSQETDIIPFESAYNNLKIALTEVDKKNRELMKDQIRHENYHRVIQITMHGRAEGTFHVELTNGDLVIAPESYPYADAYIDCSYDNLINMALGKITVDKLFLNGQLKIAGNLSKGYEVRFILAPVEYLR